MLSLFRSIFHVKSEVPAYSKNLILVIPLSHHPNTVLPNGLKNYSSYVSCLLDSYCSNKKYFPPSSLQHCPLRRTRTNPFISPPRCRSLLISLYLSQLKLKLMGQLRHFFHIFFLLFLLINNSVSVDFCFRIFICLSIFSFVHFSLVHITYCNRKNFQSLIFIN